MDNTATEKINLPKADSKNEDERISFILLPDQNFEAEKDEYVELPETSLEMLTRYYHFLLDKLPAGLKMTGREDLGYFAWEECFIWGDVNDEEYEALKKQYTSCDDQFEFIRLSSLSEEFGLTAEVKRISDQKIFLIPLVDLDGCKKKTGEHQLVSDYSSWFVNFGPESM